MTFPAILFTIIGILCVLYGIAVFLIRSGTMFYAVWLALGTCSRSRRDSSLSHL